MKKTDNDSAWHKFRNELKANGFSTANIQAFKADILAAIDEAVAEAKFKERVAALLRRWVPTATMKSITDFTDELLSRVQKILDGDESKIVTSSPRKKQSTRAKRSVKKK